LVFGVITVVDLVRFSPEADPEIRIKCIGLYEKCRYISRGVDTGKRKCPVKCA
jgi:hypothetical protein